MTQDNSNASSTTVDRPFTVVYDACKDPGNNVWRMRVVSITGGVDIAIHTGGSRDPDANPPTSQAEAQDAVTTMKGYFTRGSRGSWHTAAASIAHEGFHYREWQCSSEHYWPAGQTAIENLTVPLASAANAAAAVAAMKASADTQVADFRNKAKTYWDSLPDNAGARPYAAGQLVLNQAIQRVQQLAATKGWTVPQGVDTPNPEPPCFKAFP